MINDNTDQIKKQVEKIQSEDLYENSIVRVQIQGVHHVEVTYLARPTRNVTKKISADEYVDLRTGEIKQFNKNKNKQKNNLSETFRNLTALIRTNFDADNEHTQLFVTLTYAENMTDTVRLMEDWESFWKRLKRSLKDHKLDYIAVAEPQERGAWHFHVMMKSDKYLFVDNRDMEKLWGHGMTDTERLKSDDVGRYYVAYFTDLFGELGANAKKKGARLHMYPVGMRFYRCSRGIKRPENLEMVYKDVVERWGKPDYRASYKIKDEDGEAIQLVQREHFKID